MHDFLVKRAAKKNKGKTHTSLNIGDSVLILAERQSDANQNIAAKLLDIYQGPFTVARRISDDTY